MYQFGFIGAGHMGGALAEAVCRKLNAAEVIAADRNCEKLEALSEKCGCKIGTVVQAAQARFIVLGVKPQGMEALFEELKPLLNVRTDRFVLVTMAAGIEIKRIQEFAGNNYPVIRIMPNTPVSCGNGCVLYTVGSEVGESELSDFLDAMASCGEFIKFPEELINAGCAVSGCGPAFVYLFIEALRDAALKLGIGEEAALKLAEQTVYGSSMLAIESKKPTETLWREVATPGGATIEGVKLINDSELQKIITDAVTASFNRTVELAGK